MLFVLLARIDDAVLAVIEEWVGLVVEQRFADAMAMLGPSGSWTPELLATVIRNYGSVEPREDGETFAITPIATGSAQYLGTNGSTVVSSVHRTPQTWHRACPSAATIAQTFAIRTCVAFSPATVSMHRYPPPSRGSGAPAEHHRRHAGPLRHPPRARSSMRAFNSVR